MDSTQFRKTTSPRVTHTTDDPQTAAGDPPTDSQCFSILKRMMKKKKPLRGALRLAFMELETLKDLYIHELKDLYSAESQIIKALPKMVKAASNAELRKGFLEHLAQTKEHAVRLEKILKSHDETTRGPKCKGTEGMLKEGDELIHEEADEEVRDAGLIAAAQRVEHYEMAGYGCARTYAEMLGDKAGAKLLQTTLDEERATDQKLTKLAVSTVNVAAKSR